MGKTTLTLTVEAKTLYDMIDPADPTVLDYCILSDQDGDQAIKDAIKDHEFYVEKDKDVRWEGEAVARSRPERAANPPLPPLPLPPPSESTNAFIASRAPCRSAIGFDPGVYPPLPDTAWAVCANGAA